MSRARELTAAVLIPAVLWILIGAPRWAFTVLVAAAAGVALWEFLGMLRSPSARLVAIAAFPLFLGLVAAAHFGSLPTLVALGAATVIGLPTLVLLSAPPPGSWLPAAGGSVLAVLYVGTGAASVVALRSFGWKPVLFVLAVVWAGDSAAYYSGRRFGRRSLAPAVSPKKTWEGFWGQLAAGAAIGALLGQLLAGAFQRGPGALAAGAALGLLVSVAAVVGDLVESTFKRSCDVKDSGGLLPGHGGLLDRLDSLLYTSPVLLGTLLALPGLVPR